MKDVDDVIDALYEDAFAVAYDLAAELRRIGQLEAAERVEKAWEEVVVGFTAIDLGWDS